MTKQEIGSKVHELCENAERELNEMRIKVAQEQAYMRQHNYEMEFNALEYRYKALGDADYILFRLKEKIFELFDADYKEE